MFNTDDNRVTNTTNNYFIVIPNIDYEPKQLKEFIESCKNINIDVMKNIGFFNERT